MKTIEETALSGKAAVPAAEKLSSGDSLPPPPRWRLSQSARSDTETLSGKAAVPAAARPVAVEFPSAISAVSSHFASCLASVASGKHNLPHWGLGCAIVFVTFRLADSLPESILGRWMEDMREWAVRNPEPWTDEVRREYTIRFTTRMERWLDRGHGKCILADGNCRSIVASAIEHFNGERYRLHSYVIMPNHVHVLFELPERDALPRILHSWKSFTSKALNKVLGTSGEVWMRDYHDRIVRNTDHYNRCLAYIRKNAMTAAKMAALPVSAKQR